MVTIEDLEKAFSNYTLKNVLKMLSDNELESLKQDLLHTYTSGVRKYIYDEIVKEIEYRKDEDLAFHMFMLGKK